MVCFSLSHGFSKSASSKKDRVRRYRSTSFQCPVLMVIIGKTPPTESLRGSERCRGKGKEDDDRARDSKQRDNVLGCSQKEVPEGRGGDRSSSKKE